jgi:hypothetical protein
MTAQDILNETIAAINGKYLLMISRRMPSRLPRFAILFKPLMQPIRVLTKRYIDKAAFFLYFTLQI